MVSNETIELWKHWLIIFACCVVSYSTAYTIIFRKQFSNNNKEIMTKESKSSQTYSTLVKSNVKTINEKQSMDTLTIEYNQNSTNDKDIDDAFGMSDYTYSPLNCMKYASCVCSLTNATICSLSSLSIFYHQYWQDLIYGTPGVPFYVSCAVQAYFMVDLLADITVYFVHKLPSFRYDQLIHHLFSFCVIPWMIIPTPTYAWFMITLSYAMEISTLFLDFSFFGKWHQCKPSLIFKFKLGFVFTWFVFRCPATIALIVWLIIYGNRLSNEYPTHKFIGAVFIIVFNFIMQFAWSVLIIRKTYRAMVAKPENKSDETNGIDLKRRRNSIDITNVTTEA